MPIIEMYYLEVLLDLPLHFPGFGRLHRVVDPKDCNSTLGLRSF